MSVKKEPSGRRSVQVEVEVPGSPEEVWAAIATGPGVSSWFVPTEVINGPDGKPKEVKMSFGPGMDSVATYTAWDPPRRFSAESTWGPDQPPIATEWIVEARTGGKCVVRVVHSLFASTDDWDNQLESTEFGWPFFFKILRLYLTHFRGQPSAKIQGMAFSMAAEAEAWGSLAGPLGFAGTTAGQRWTSPAGLPRLGGVVEESRDGDHPYVMVRLDEPAPGIATFAAFVCGGPTQVQMNVWLYGNKAAELAKRDDPAWQKWQAEKFPAQQAPAA
jgi:uncharacterized protein YndB with AHSA1/START domain